jgi:hypothetical protein
VLEARADAVQRLLAPNPDATVIVL